MLENFDNPMRYSEKLEKQQFLAYNLETVNFRQKLNIKVVFKNVEYKNR